MEGPPVRNSVRRLLSAALAAALFAAPLRALAADALGQGLDDAATVLHEGTELFEGTYWSEDRGDLCRENYVVYTPGEAVRPVVTFGGATTTLTSVPAAAQALEEQGLRVVAGVNGDYYGVSHGVPLGSVMADGVLRNATSDHYAVGFRRDGTAILGEPSLSIRALLSSGKALPIHAFNHVRQSDFGIFLYDDSFNARSSTGTNEPGVDVICSVRSGRLSIGETLTVRVDEVLTEATDTAVPEGKYVLTANHKAGAAYTAPLLALAPGDTLRVRVEAEDEAWDDVEQMLGALYQLVENGAVCKGLPTGSAPRTAVGQRGDGSLVLYTVDGRQSGRSVGASLTQVAQRLVELGCVTALSLDGGGSTTLVATMPNETAARLVNAPSEGNARPVSNQLFLVADPTPSRRIHHVYLVPETRVALAGAEVALTVAAIDTNYLPMKQFITLSTDGGTIRDGVLTLPDKAGTVTVTAWAGAVSASCRIEVVAAPDSVELLRGSGALDTLTLSPGDSVALSARALVRHLTAAGGDELFTWTLSPGVGTLDEHHVFTAAPYLTTGTLALTAGKTTRVIPIYVVAQPLRTLLDFETDFVFAAGAETDGTQEVESRATLTRTVEEAQVRLGRAVGRLEYAFAAAHSARVGLDLPIDAGYDRLSAWVLSDGSGALLSIETDDGTISPMLTLDTPGWQAITVDLPQGAARVTGLSLTAAEATEGTICLDQLVLTYGSLVDTEAPAVELTLDYPMRNLPEPAEHPDPTAPDLSKLSPSDRPATLTGKVFDAIDGASLRTLEVRFDGKPTAFTFDTKTGALSAVLPALDAYAHRVTVTAGDASGNLVRWSEAIPAASDAEPVFLDTKGHWAAEMIDQLGRSGVSNGDGAGNYHPDESVTRQEFATLLYRYLGISDEYAGADVPFADAALTAPWAQAAMRATYALGIVKGVGGADGALRFEPNATITRQEALTMLGRLLPRGYDGAAAETGYSDFDTVASWAAEHVRALRALGILDDTTDGAVHPTDEMTRAQVAAALYRML